MSVIDDGGIGGLSWFSSAHCCTAPSIWRRLLMQAFFCDVRAGADEVGNRDRSQQADDGHDDHDFHQGEARLAGCSIFHTCSLSFCFRGVNSATGGLYNYGCCSLIACCNRTSDIASGCHCDCDALGAADGRRHTGHPSNWQRRNRANKKGLGLLPGPGESTNRTTYCTVSSSLCVLGSFRHVGLACTVVTA